MFGISLPVLVKIVFPLVVVLMGFCAARLLERLDERTLAAAALFVFVPALLFRQSLELPIAQHEFTLLLFYMLFHTGALYLIASQVLYWLNTPASLRHVYLLHIITVNLFALRALQPYLGEPAQSVLAIQILIFFHLALFAFLGVYLSIEKLRLDIDLLALLQTPLPYALLAGVGLAFFDVTLPFEVLATVESLTNTGLHLALLVAGVVVGRHIFLLRAHEYSALLGGLVFCLVFRLLVSPLLAAGISTLMGIEDPSLRRSVILAAGAPAGPLALILICVYGRTNEKRFSALCVVLTALLSLVTLPAGLMLINRWLPVTP